MSGFNILKGKQHQGSCKGEFGGIPNVFTKLDVFFLQIFLKTPCTHHYLFESFSISVVKQLLPGFLKQMSSP
jgi:hypothetical protein